MDYGFATRLEYGSTYIPECQLQRIINIDKTCLWLDGSDGCCGERPAKQFFTKVVSVYFKIHHNHDNDYWELSLSRNSTTTFSISITSQKH